MIEQLIILGLAGFRMAYFLVYEDGPFDIAEKFRSFVGIKEGEVVGFLPRLFSCIYCTSVWTTFIAYGLWLLDTTLPLLIGAMSLTLLIDQIRR